MKSKIRVCGFLEIKGSKEQENEKGCFKWQTKKKS